MKTPWVLVAIHAPWYHTYKGHYKEVECMRQAYEPLLVAHQVDLVLSGHVHAYERSKPVVSYQVGRQKGPTVCVRAWVFVQSCDALSVRVAHRLQRVSRLCFKKCLDAFGLCRVWGRGEPDWTGGLAVSWLCLLHINMSRW